MKIKSVYLESFGKFQEQRIDFRDGINVIFGNNESGKSTIHQFCGAVFYGFVKPNLKHTRYLDAYYDYEPMARNLYKGKVTFEHNGKFYELERDFSAKTYSLFDAETHEDKTHEISMQDKGLDAPGQVFFGLEFSAFSNLLYFAQNHRDFTINDTEMIRSSIRTLVESHGNGYSLESAVEYLDRKRTEIGTKKNPERILGRLESKRREMEANRMLLENRLMDRTSIILERNVLEKKMEETQAKLETTDTAIWRNVKAQLALLEKEKIRIEEYVARTKKRIAVIELDSVEDEDVRLFDELNVNKTRIEEKNALVSERLSDLKKNIEAIEAKKVPENPDPDLAEVQELEKRIEVEQSKNSHGTLRGIKTALYVLGFAIGLASVFYYYFDHDPIAMIGFGIGFLMLVIGLLLHDAKIDESTDERYAKRLEEIYQRYGANDRETFLQITLDKKNSLLDYYSNIRYLEKLRSDYSEVSEVKKKIEAERSENRQDYHYLYEKYNVSDKQSMQARINEFQELPLLKKKLEQLESESQYTDDFYNALLQGPENAASRMNSLLQTQGLLDEKKELQKFLQEMQHKAGELKGRIESLEDEYEHFESLKSDIARTEWEIKTYEKELKTIEKTKKYLGEAASVVSSRATPMVAETASKFFFIITGEENRNILISPSLEIYLYDDIHRTPLRQLSEGTKEQVYLAIRMALTEILAPGLPIFFDESFVHFDKNRLMNTFALLETFHNTRQVITFTSDHDEALCLAKRNEDVNLIELR